MSTAGLALGVMVLITVLSVMNGFNTEIEKQVFSLASQITVTNVQGELASWPQLRQSILTRPGVVGAAPIVTGTGMLVANGRVQGIQVTGIQPSLESQVSSLASKMIEGVDTGKKTIQSLKAGQFGIIIGKQIAASLGVGLGDRVTLVTPTHSVSPIGIMPDFKRFTVVGIFHASNGFGFDSMYAFIDLRDAQALYRFGDHVSGLQLKLKQVFQAPNISSEITTWLNQTQPLIPYVATNWTQQYGPMFNAIEMQKNIMFLVLLLIIMVAAFNLVCTLVMVVNEKRSDIAILKTLGASRGLVLRVFIIQGMIIASIGIVVGVMLGVLLAEHVNAVVTWIQSVFGIEIVSPSVYLTDRVPSLLSSFDVVHVTIAAFLVCLTATLYPAFNASKTQPAEALRYE